MFKRIIALNGIAIIGVVLTHAAGWGQIAMFLWTDRYLPVSAPNYDQLGSLTYYLLLIIRQLTSFAVPAFLFSTGFFIAYAIRGSAYSANSWKFVKARLVSLLIPYTIWSVVIFISDYYINEVRLVPLDYARIFFTSGATGPYYFVPLLASFYLLSPFLAPIAKNKTHLLLWVTFIIQIIPIVARYIGLVFQIQSPVLDTINDWSPPWFAPRWGFFFAAGLAAGYYVDRVRNFLETHRKQLLTATLFFAVLAVAEPEVIYRTTNQEMRWLPLTFGGLLYSFSATLLLLSLNIENSIFSRQFFWLGSRTYGIYLTHMKSMEFIARLIYHFAAFILGIEILYQPILILFGLGVPVLMMLLVLKTPLRKVYPYLFG